MPAANAALPGLWLALQYALVALAVLASAWVVVAKQFPRGARRLRTAAALWLLREPRTGWLRALGRRIAPPATAGADGCGGCDGCGPDDGRPNQAK